MTMCVLGSHIFKVAQSIKLKLQIKSNNAIAQSINLLSHKITKHTIHKNTSNFSFVTIQFPSIDRSC